MIKFQKNKNNFTICKNSNSFDLQKDYIFFFNELKFLKKTKNYNKLKNNYKIFKLKEKNFQFSFQNYKLEKFFITISNTWKIYNEQPIGFHCLFSTNLHHSEKKVVVGNHLNPSLILSKPGFFLQKNGSEIFFQAVLNTFFKQASLVKIDSFNYLKKNAILGYELILKKQSKDIVQGLPKIESLIEAYSSKNDQKLFNRSSLFFSKYFLKTNYFSEIDTENIFFQSHLTNDIIVSYKRLFYKLIPLGTYYIPKKMNSLLTIQDCDDFFVKAIKNKSITNLCSLGNYLFYDQKNSKIFQYESKIFNRKKKKSSIDEYWPFFTKNVWLYRLEKFKLFKWIKIRPILWIPGLSKIISLTAQKFFLGFSKDLINNFIIQNTNGRYYYLQFSNFLENHKIVKSKTFNSNQFSFPLLNTVKSKTNKIFNFIYLGENLFQNSINIQNIFMSLYKYHSIIDGSYRGAFKSLYKFQLLLAFSIDDSYKLQGIKISLKNIEIVVKQMTDKVLIEDPKTTGLIPLEILKLIIIKEICKSIILFNNSSSISFNKLKQKRFDFFQNFPLFKPKLLSATASVFTKEGFLSQAGFQNTKKVLTQASIEGSLDWLTNLKQQIITGQILTAGSTFLNSKYNLDTIYYFKKI